MQKVLSFSFFCLFIYGCVQPQTPQSPRDIYKNELIRRCNLGQYKHCKELAELVQKDNPTYAISLYERVCRAGDASACVLAGDIYASGQYLKQSKENAKHFYGLACDLGSQVGCREFKHY